MIVNCTPCIHNASPEFVRLAYEVYILWFHVKIPEFLVGEDRFHRILCKSPGCLILFWSSLAIQAILRDISLNIGSKRFIPPSATAFCNTEIRSFGLRPFQMKFSCLNLNYTFFIITSRPLEIWVWEVEMFKLLFDRRKKRSSVTAPSPEYCSTVSIACLLK